MRWSTRRIGSRALSFVQGAVSLQPADAQDWIDATLNRPLTTGDRVWADSGARAELQVGTATIRIDENSGLSFTDLDADVLQVQLTDGAMTLHVYSLDANETVEIDTPNATVMIRQPGEYAIDTEEDGDRTIVKTRAGEAEVTGADQHGYIVRTNEQGIFSGNDELSSVMTQVARRSAFETWAYERENIQSQSVASRYVAPGVVGYQDLDRNGTWAYEPEYGNVWQPTTYVINDWAPYRYGRWVWVTPWGWTWIDDAPWGFAPFHYGRWAYLRHRWCWVPGPVHGRPTYAPALVAWVGPPSFGVDFRNPNVGWFPLGPREIYLPGSRTSWRYFNSVNSTNAAFADTTELSNAYNGRDGHRDYRNRTAPHAVTVVDHDAFVGAHRTLGKRKDVDANDLQHWRDRAGPPPIEPSRESRLGARPSTRVAPSAGSSAESVGTRRAAADGASAARSAADGAAADRAAAFVAGRFHAHAEAGFAAAMVRQQHQRGIEPVRTPAGHTDDATRSPDDDPNAESRDAAGPTRPRHRR